MRWGAWRQICRDLPTCFSSCVRGFGNGRISGMREYELVLIVKSSLSEDKRKKVLDTVKGWLKDIKIGKEDNWGLRPLAYKIKHETSGFFTRFSLEAKDAIPTDFEKRILGVEDVIRHLLIRKK